MEGKQGITLGYWNIRGRGQVLRLLLAYTGLKWTYTTYKSAGEWFGKGKTSLGLYFPNLPYLLNGDFKLTESIAIARYIIRKSGKTTLLGKNVEDYARVYMILSLLDDIFNPTFSLFFSPNYEAESKRLFEGKIKGKLQELVNYIGYKDYAIGYLTLADFKIAEASYYFEKMFADNVPHLEVLIRIRKNLEVLPEIVQYYKSEHAVHKPFLPEYAKLTF